MLMAAKERHYLFKNLGLLLTLRLLALDCDFTKLQECQQNWPPILPHPKDLYTNFYQIIKTITNNIICGSCGCVYHSISDIHYLPCSSAQLSSLAIDPDIVPFDFSSGVPALDDRNIMVDKLALESLDGVCGLTLCSSCYNNIISSCWPAESLANHPWIGQVPDMLLELSWIEEMLVACVHFVGCVV